MVQIRMVGPLYIDDDLEPKKFETLFKMPPGGGQTPILGPYFGKVPEGQFQELKKGSARTLGCQKLISIAKKWDFWD